MDAKVLFEKGKRVPLTPSKQCELFFRTDDGALWRLDKMPFFVPIYDKPADKVLLFTSRQSTKTTFIRNAAGRESMMERGNSILYVAPTDSQVTDFSTKKLDKIFDYNESLAKMFKGRIWNIHQKQFNTGSSITLRSTGGAQGAGRIRGNTANGIFLDEFQDLIPEDIPVIEECAATFDGMDGRKKARYVYTGTPLSSQNHIQLQYNRSKKWQWHIQCPHCSEWDGNQNKLIKGWNDPVGIDHIDVAKPFLFCQQCGRDMNSPRGTPARFDGNDRARKRVPPHGMWLSHNPEGNFDGYRIVRLMMPWVHWRTPKDDGVLDKYHKYPERQFFNEVLGLSYDAGAMPITEDVVRASCADYELPITEDQIEKVAKEHQQYFKYAGLDWAMQATKEDTASYTIFGVFALVNGKLKLIFAHRFVGKGSNDPDHVLDKVKHWMNLFEIKRLGADYGVGYKEDLRLVEQFGLQRVAIFQYKGGSTVSKSTYDPASLKWLVPKTRTLDQLCDDIKMGRFQLPKYTVARTYTDDWLRLTLEEKPESRYHLYTRIGPDDFVHVTNYANMAKRLDFREGEFGMAEASMLPSTFGSIEPGMQGLPEAQIYEPLDNVGLHY